MLRRKLRSRPLAADRPKRNLRLELGSKPSACLHTGSSFSSDDPPYAPVSKTGTTSLRRATQPIDSDLAGLHLTPAFASGLARQKLGNYLKFHYGSWALDWFARTVLCSWLRQGFGLDGQLLPPRGYLSVYRYTFPASPCEGPPLMAVRTGDSHASEPLLSAGQRGILGDVASNRCAPWRGSHQVQAMIAVNHVLTRGDACAIP